MKLLNLILVAMISLIIISCSNKELMEPNSAETEILNKTGSAAFDVGLMQHRGFGHGLLGVLDLTDAQKNQLKGILQSRKEKMGSMRDSFDSRPSREEMQIKRKEFRESIKAEIYAVLTPEQQTRLADIEAQLESGVVPQELIDLRIKQLNEKVNLTEDQVDQFKALDTWNKLLLRKKPDGNPKDFFAEKRSLFNKHKEQILNILNQKQQNIFLEMLKKIKQRLGERAHRFGSEHAKRRIGHMIAALDLNETQQDQLKEIFENVRPNIKAQLQEQRDGRNRTEMRRTMREKMQEIDAQIKTILNPEQLQKYEELKAERKEKMPGHFE